MIGRSIPPAPRTVEQPTMEEVAAAMVCEIDVADWTGWAEDEAK